MAIAYFVKNGMYLNITNQCNNNCIFCLKHFQSGVGDYDLKLERDPTYREIIKDIEEKAKGKNFDEIVFCGVGEPLLRLDGKMADGVLLPLTEKLRQDYKEKRVRLVTSGQASILFPGRDVAGDLAGAGVGKVSISLNAETAFLYNLLCQPKYAENPNDPRAYESVLDFIKKCRQQDKVRQSKGQSRLEVEVTALNIPPEKMCDSVSPPNIERCREIAKSLDVEFRLREYYGPK